MFSFLTNKLYEVYEKMKGITSLDEVSLSSFFQLIKNNLIDADVPLIIIDKVIANLKKRIIGVKINKHIQPGEYVAKEFYTVILHLLQSSQDNAKKEIIKNFITGAKQAKKPFLLFLVGLQGAGKTTTIGKIIHIITNYPQKLALKNEDIGVFSLDYDRPAAREQLRIIAEKSKIEYLSIPHGENAIIGAQNLLDTIQKQHITKKIIIVDTAGRLTIDAKMMQELKEIYTILKPQELFLVIDAMISQEGIEIARQFTETIRCSGCIITKVDSDAPGGIILGLTSLLALPILYVTFGEKTTEIKPFDPVTAAKKLIGMGEILSLVKSAEEKIAQEEEKMLEEAFKRGDITIDEFIKIITVLSRLGPMKYLLSMIPKDMLGGMQVDSSAISQIESFSKNIIIMSQSMTKKERSFPNLLLENQQRKKRIAQGCGMSIVSLEQILNLFFKMRNAFNMYKKFIK